MNFQLLMRKLKKIFIKNTIEMTTVSAFIISGIIYFSGSLFTSESILLAFAALTFVVSFFTGLVWMVIHLVLRLLFCSSH